MSRSIFCILATSAALLASTPALAQFQKPEDAVKYRKSAFQVMGTHFGRLGAMAQGRVPFDAAAATANAEVVAFVSNLPYAGLVEGTSGTEKGTPKANVWTDRAKFDMGAKKLQEESVKLVAAAKSNNFDQFKTAFGTVAGTCKACHDDYRNP